MVKASEEVLILEVWDVLYREQTVFVSDVKYARVSTSIPTVNMWCAHTTNPRQDIGRSNNSVWYDKWQFKISCLIYENVKI
jgi:hypothetical protein